jgi:hypothetical protein
VTHFLPGRCAHARPLGVVSGIEFNGPGILTSRYIDVNRKSVQVYIAAGFNQRNRDRFSYPVTEGGRGGIADDSASMVNRLIAEW